MKTSDKGVAFIAAHEGIVTRAYRDVAGVWTIGVGHANTSGQAPKVTAGMVITRDEAMQILASDLPTYERRTDKAMPGAGQAAFDGGVSFDFNTGAIHKASWAAQWRAGGFAASRSALMLWTKAGGRTIAGLVSRRQAEARLIFDGDYGAIADRSAAAGIEAVKTIQRQLAALGLYTGAIDGKGGDGSLTEGAIKAFQRANGLVVDGIAGPATRATLTRAVEAKTAGKAATGGAIGGAGTSAGTELQQDPSALDWHMLLTAGAWALAAAGAVLLLFLLWRYRGVILRRRTPS